MLKKYINCVWLNLHVLRLALAQKWLSKADFETSYDQIAPYYDDTWLKHLRLVTDRLLAQLPQMQPGRILDLGCGTGYTTQYLVEHYPDQPLTAVDISAKMLVRTGERLVDRNVQCVHADMLEYMQAQPVRSAAMIVSGWAIGYSNPDRLIKEAARVLIPGGIFAFVVNYADTLQPVLLSFRKCMSRFPAKVSKAYIPHFPKNWKKLRKRLQKHGFTLVWHDEGEQLIAAPSEGGSLAWLLKTGVLAGFDRMLPLMEHGEVARHFDHLMQENTEPITHHYVAVVARI